MPYGVWSYVAAMRHVSFNKFNVEIHAILQEGLHRASRKLAVRLPTNQNEI